jgi:glutamate N-acetyltransferase/amino-acid N-acetyltransferase
MAREGRTPRVAGFRFSGVRCGIKERGLDLALIASDRPASAAGIFTRSTVPGAPVLLSKQRLRAGRAQAIVVNSGISNVAMGEAGRRAALEMSALAAAELEVPAAQMLVASTGVIGEPLPIDKIRRGVPRAARALDPAGLPKAARAIMTTDTVPKLAGRTFRVRGRRYAVAGIAKASGMIQPRMATMLAFLVCDAPVAPAFLKLLWREVADDTFNRVTIDGETSTSDSAVVLANGAGGGPLVTGSRSAAARGLRETLHHVATELSRALARDGEGATKLVTVEVAGARSNAQAERAARAIANSPLVKTALYGGDPNWGRILQSVGAARVALRLERTGVDLCGVPVFQDGASAGPAARARAGRRLRAAEVGIRVRLGAGRGNARLWTCDYSPEYIHINADYTT